MSRRLSEHERAIRGYQEYQKWKELAEFIEKAEPPEILRMILVLYYHSESNEKAFADNSYKRAKQALDLTLKDRYPGFVVLERLRGKRKDER